MHGLPKSDGRSKEGNSNMLESSCKTLYSYMLDVVSKLCSVLHQYTNTKEAFYDLLSPLFNARIQDVFSTETMKLWAVLSSMNAFLSSLSCVTEPNTTLDVVSFSFADNA